MFTAYENPANAVAPVAGTFTVVYSFVNGLHDSHTFDNLRDAKECVDGLLDFPDLRNVTVVRN